MKNASPGTLAVRVALGISLAFLGMAGAVWAFGLHLVTTPSVPVGLYRETHEPIEKGRYVVICLPDEIARFGVQRGYVQPGTCADGTQPVIKRIEAVAGDTVEVQPDGVRVNGERLTESAVAAVDSQGRALPHVPWGRYTVSVGEVWVLARHDRRSWDSRYFGPIGVNRIVSTAREVWVSA